MGAKRTRIRSRARRAWPVTPIFAGLCCLMLCSCGPAGIAALLSSSGGGGGSGGPAPSQPPDTFIAAGSVPALPSSDTSIAFVFSASKPGCTFVECIGAVRFAEPVSGVRVPVESHRATSTPQRLLQLVDVILRFELIILGKVAQVVCS